MYKPTRPVFLPSPEDEKTCTLPLNNIQGDILAGLVKKTETYFFFEVTNVALFKTQFSTFVPYVTDATNSNKIRKDVYNHKKSGKEGLVPVAAVNVAFSYKGLTKLIKDNLFTDTHFSQGQKNDLQALGDDAKNWLPTFVHGVDGVILVAGTDSEVDQTLTTIKRIFGVDGNMPSLKKIDEIKGITRPDPISAHEHFGFLDGISNPLINGYSDNERGPNDPPAINAGYLITGYESDPDPNRPEWQKDGSFLVFRYLSQKVPEFNEFLNKNAIVFPGYKIGMSDDSDEISKGSELLGARMMGRWKSGAPIDLSPFRDFPELAKDEKRINGFKYAAQKLSQRSCPFAAHARKMHPRDDIPQEDVNKHRIIRRGIQFGREVTREEKESKITRHDRGLLFVSYQASIKEGFFFLQNSWANNVNFSQPRSGFDPIIGQGKDKSMIGTHPDKPDASLSFGDFVVSKGGEYFFSPSLKCLREEIPKPIV